MKKLLEKQAVFNVGLKVLAFLSTRKWLDWLTCGVTKQAARLNLFLNRPKTATEVQDLANTWQALMPVDSKAYFQIKEVKGDTAYTEIHLHCPLRDTGKVDACYKLMNYDRSLMAATGGQLIVLESQANSGKSYCRLAIRKKGRDTSDLIPAHLASNPTPL